MKEVYDPEIMIGRVDNAVSAVNSLLAYVEEVLPKNSRLRGLVEYVDEKVTYALKHLEADPYSEWVGISEPGPRFKVEKGTLYSAADVGSVVWLVRDTANNSIVAVELREEHAYDRGMELTRQAMTKP